MDREISAPEAETFFKLISQFNSISAALWSFSGLKHAHVGLFLMDLHKLISPLILEPN